MRCTNMCINVCIVNHVVQLKYNELEYTHVPITKDPATVHQQAIGIALCTTSTIYYLLLLVSESLFLYPRPPPSLPPASSTSLVLSLEIVTRRNTASSLHKCLPLSCQHLEF